MEPYFIPVLSQAKLQSFDLVERFVCTRTPATATQHHKKRIYDNKRKNLKVPNKKKNIN
jgi:hypothetical protein